MRDWITDSQIFEDVPFEDLTEEEVDALYPPPEPEQEEDDIEDIDCESCGLKFWVRIQSSDSEHYRPLPTKCPRCLKGLPPPYEY